jgi:ADP-heptose:LPS heptosyltransferase
LLHKVGGFHFRFQQWVAENKVRSFREAGADFPRYAATQLLFDIPREEQEFAANFVRRAAFPRIIILPGAATFQKAPSCEFWGKLCSKISDIFPRAEIVFIGMGGLKRGATRGMQKADVDKLEHFSVRNAFDIGIIKQLAICQLSNVFVSPHSGMAFAAQCVQLPWLALSGHMNHEYLANVDRPIRCMDDFSLESKLPEIMDALMQLIEKRIPYRTCVHQHVAKLKQVSCEHELSFFEFLPRGCS